VIERVSILLIIVIALPDVYVYMRYLRRRPGIGLWQKLVWWLPGIALTACTVALSFTRDFVPDNILWLNAYLFLFGLIAVPKFLFIACSAVGLLLRRVFHLHRNWGNFVGVPLAVAAVCILLYGSFWGVDKLVVKRVDIVFGSLPKAFDGYRIVQITDAHVGSIHAGLLLRAVEAANQLAPDAIVFTGDLQNKQPGELDRFAPILSSLHARDGVFSVLGNHDYGQYINVSDAEKRVNEAALRRRERAFGWQLLLNDNVVVRRDGDSIVIAGEENDGLPPFPSRADISATLRGVGQEAFVVMLQHDPSAWRRHILPSGRAWLTLSGHTHGGQVSLFGKRPTQLSGKEDCGLYEQSGRFLYVSSGLGGVVPFRFGIPPEIVVITLRSKAVGSTAKK